MARLILRHKCDLAYLSYKLTQFWVQFGVDQDAFDIAQVYQDLILVRSFLGTYQSPWTSPLCYDHWNYGCVWVFSI